MAIDINKWKSYYGTNPGEVIYPFPNGDRFRSKTEAHWAVFFNEIGIKYEYEPQWFNGRINYRPDFFVPGEELDRNTWIEIKPNRLISKIERQKAFDLAFKTRADVLFFCGHPWNFQAESYHWYKTMEKCTKCGNIGCAHEDKCPKCGLCNQEVLDICIDSMQSDSFLELYQQWVKSDQVLPFAWDVYNGKDIITWLVMLGYFVLGSKSKMELWIDGVPGNDPYGYVGLLPCDLEADTCSIEKAICVSRATRFDYWIRS